MDQYLAFKELLVKLNTASDNEQRKDAEATYETIELSQKVTLLIAAAADLELSVEFRQLALVLLRRLLVNDYEELIKLWDPASLLAFKSQILARLQIEPNQLIRRKFCDVLAEIARNGLDESGAQTWPEILNFLFEWANSADDGLKESALNIFESVPGIFGTQQRHYITVIKDMVSKCLQHPTSLKVRSDAVKATTAFLCDNNDDIDVVRFFNDLLGQMLLICAEQAQADDGGDETVFQCLVDLADSVPKIFRSKLADTCTLCLKIMGSSEIDPAFQHSALEVMVELCENAAPMMRKDGSKFIPDLIQQCLKLMVEVDDDEHWGEADNEDDEDEDSDASIGESSLDRVAVGLGGKAVLGPCLQLIPVMVHNADWKYRYAGMMALGAIGEGCHKLMEPILDKVVDSICPFFLDPHPRVRYAACNAIGQMSSDFAPTIQKRFIAKILPNLLQLLGDNENPRVQAHAGAALVNFSEDCPKNQLSPYLEVIMAKLEVVLQDKFKELASGGKKLVLEQIITTIASVADTVEAKFTPYYDRVMPCLKYILEHAITPELRLLRGKTIESISLIGLAVGSEKFLVDANDVMQLLVKTQVNFGAEDDDDPQVSYMISAWARMCKILGKQFEQYLPLVMPAVVKTASLKPEVAILESDEAKTMEEENDWQFVNIGDQQSFGIRTCGLEDKATACQMLVCYARELKEGFAPYVDEVTKLMVPMLKFYFHDGVRVAAAESLPYLLESAQCRGGNFVMEMWQFICPELLKAIEMDPDNDAMGEHMYSLAKCIEVLGNGCLSEEQLFEVKKLLEKHLTDHFKKAEARKEKRKDEDYDDEVEKELMNEDDEDVYLLSKISDILHALFGTYKEAILPFFDSLLPLFTQLLEVSRPDSDIQWGICIFDDVVEFTGSNSVKYQSVFVPAMLRGLSCETPEVRQAAAYGYGIMAMHGGNPYAQSCTDAIPHLVKMITSPNARENEVNTSATENAIAAVAKILKYNSSMVDPQQIIPHWLSWLPTWEDVDESPHIYGYLCDLIESNNPLVVGENHSNLPRIVAIIAEAFLRKAVEDCAPTKTRLITLLRQIQAQSDMFQACLSTLNAEQIAALQEALATAG